MIREREKMHTKENDFIEDAENQYNEWQDDLKRLQETIASAGTKFKQAYSEQISDLQRYLHDVEEKLNEMKASDPEQWEEQRLSFRQSSRSYAQAYGEAIRRMKEAESESKGWLEGFTDHPPTGSAGWLEGTDATTEGSEGWVEGMAEKSTETEGWTEGYGDK